VGSARQTGRIDITLANLSILKTNKGRAIRFTTLDALCRVLECQPARYWSSCRIKNFTGTAGFRPA
jgi:hypothetical protein